MLVTFLDNERASTPTIITHLGYVSPPTRCSPVLLDRCEHCDLHVELKSFHLMSATPAKRKG